MEINYSLHAFERVKGRISMTHKELADILDADLALNIGQENKSNRVHKIFYSARDKMCFVVIQDIKTKTVVTVLPIDYHENISWIVPIELQNQAKNLIIQNDVNTTDKSEILNTNAPAFRISGTIVNQYGEYIKVVNLGHWRPCLPYDYSVDELVKDSKFIEFLIDKIEDKINKLHNSTYSICIITIRLGKKGEPVSFSIADII